MILNEKEIDKQLKSLKLICRETNKMLLDERYAGYLFVLNTLLDKYDRLRKKLKSKARYSDEYLMKGIEYDSKIELINELIGKPEELEERLMELKKSVKPAKKGDKENENV